ncbi:hypothetical protein B5F76_08975 [Desulfovibrio sp. An276]|uniref:tyrosine-type recombinase/integrase n=1 Tax=Desulfovibrio sp. An276 TaxID=1965618 RepID=UPI000B3751C6|nr:tyrosine-type recombinase/integrase [Desulfovibrio sp. An276]OUO51605.1 hypothetical protein B5F76_08975 [Desulfovibrio sp. An276]
MSVSQRNDGRWIVKYKDIVSGKWRQAAFQTEEDARRFDDENQYDRQKETRLTLGAAVVDYVRTHDLCDRRKQIYSFLVNGYDRKRDGKHTEGPAEFLADKFCTELNRRDLENFKFRLLERGQKGITVNENISCLKSVLSWAESEDLIPFDPWRKYRVKVKDKVRHKNGSFRDFQAVYTTLPDYMQWACRTCMALCLRPGKELVNLEWSAFDWDTRSVKVYMSKVDRDKTVYPPESYLTEAWERYQTDKAVGRKYVCHGKSTAQLNYPSFKRRWREVCVKVGVKIAPYAMRHLVASMALAAGADLPGVSKQLGHANAGITASVYASVVAAAQQRRAAQANPLVQLGAGSKQENK